MDDIFFWGVFANPFPFLSFLQYMLSCIHTYLINVPTYLHKLLPHLLILSTYQPIYSLRNVPKYLSYWPTKATYYILIHLPTHFLSYLFT
jgi:hypothetical protein